MLTGQLNEYCIVLMLCASLIFAFQYWCLETGRGGVDSCVEEAIVQHRAVEAHAQPVDVSRLMETDESG